MEISNIILTNFRSHKKFTSRLDPITIITGPNGVGKTNILEAILTCSTTRSHRTNYDRDLIAWGEQYARVELNLVQGEDKTSISTFITTTPTFSKTYLINNIPKKTPEVVGLFQSVFFSPETLDIVYGAPSLRRRFLDIILCQSDRPYMYSLGKYNQVVKERNKLLFYIAKRGAHIDELIFWDDQLIELGGKIINSRLKLIDFISKTILPRYQSVSGGEDKPEIIYKSSVSADNFRAILNDNRQNELKYTSTLFGPHRDELVFMLNHHPIASNGSRGENRNFVLALKQAEIDYFHSLGKSPVLLLDDVFSELDSDRRLRLTSTIQSQQTIITTTDLSDIDDKIKKKAKIIKLTKE